MINTLPVIDRTDGVQDKETCQKCGGKCCQRYPGIAFPDGFGPAETLTAVLVEYFRTGFWALDCWEGGNCEINPLLRQDIWYVRPATSWGRYGGNIYQRLSTGPCALWTEEYGCSLRFNNRPRQCRTLVPNRDNPGDCAGPDDKESAALAWLPFQENLHAAAEIVLRERKDKE